MFILIPIGQDILPFVFVKLRYSQHFNVVIATWVVSFCFNFGMVVNKGITTSEWVF